MKIRPYKKANPNAKGSYQRKSYRTKKQNDDANGLLGTIPSKNGRPYNLVPCQTRPPNFKDSDSNNTKYFDFAQQVLDFYARCGNLTKASLLAGIPYKTVRAWKERNYFGFADSLVIAEEMFEDFLDDEAASRGRVSDQIFMKRLEARHSKYNHKGGQQNIAILPPINIEGFDKMGEPVDVTHNEDGMPIDQQRVFHHDPEITEDDD